jgi:hypothetical protein
MAGIAVVVQGGSLACSHSGTATVTSGSTRLTVGALGVLLSGTESGLSFPACQNKTTTQTPSPAPCVSEAATAGRATKLTVGGIRVLLAATGPTHPSVEPALVGTWSVKTAGQTKLTAV